MTRFEEFDRRFPFLTSALKKAILGDRLGHSFLVVSGNEKYRQDFPMYLGALACCASRESDGTPCGHCPTCEQLASHSYPDLFELQPLSKSRQITIGDSEDDPTTLRGFRHNFYLGSTTESGWKIGIIHDCDTMNTNAQNAFLKTLEEPPEHCLFILTTGRPGALLPTIRSRCQRLDLTDNKCTYSEEDFPGLGDVLCRLVCHATNNLVEAEECAKGLIDLLDKVNIRAETMVQENWSKQSIASQMEGLDEAVKKLLVKRQEGEIGSEYRRLREKFTGMIHAFFAQIALIANGIDVKYLPNPEIMTVFFKEQHKVKERDALRMLTLAEELCSVLRTNVNDALALRAFALNIAIKK